MTRTFEARISQRQQYFRIMAGSVTAGLSNDSAMFPETAIPGLRMVDEFRLLEGDFNKAEVSPTRT